MIIQHRGLLTRLLEKKPEMMKYKAVWMIQERGEWRPARHSEKPFALLSVYKLEGLEWNWIVDFESEEKLRTIMEIKKLVINEVPNV